jgi:pSer/pThr/pTyr-binding forkhead associated (FHA) protein
MAQRLDKSMSVHYATGVKQAVDARPKRLPKALRLSIENSRITLQINIRSTLIIGRNDHETQVDLDMTSFSGREMGVSRTHLMVVRQGPYLFAKDMGSRNGSAINNKALIPNEFHELQDGDTLHLGKLILIVSFAYDPITQTHIPTGTETNRDATSSIPDDDTTNDVRPFAKDELEKAISDKQNP